MFTLIYSFNNQPDVVFNEDIFGEMESSKEINRFGDCVASQTHRVNY